MNQSSSKAPRLKAPTIDAQLTAIGGHAQGFHLMRICLAVAIVLYHTVVTSDGFAWDYCYWTGDFRGIISTMLPTFFALSGFLVAGSLERTPKLSQFLTLRAIRLVPALGVEILLCALILGPIVTTRPLQEYFTDPEFFAYFRNIVGNIQYTLPGVFEHTPFSNMVNVSLWTVPLELQSYGLLSLLVILGLTKRRWTMLFILAAICLLEPVWRISLHETVYPGPPREWVLITCFFCGMLVFRFRDKLAFNVWLAAAALAIAIVCFSFYETMFWGAPFIAYATAVFGLVDIPKIPLLSRGDYSYGLYVFAFPIQQLFAFWFPGVVAWYWNAAFALTLGFAYAAFSWHLVENPVLQRRKQILAWVNRATEFIDTHVGRRLLALAPLRSGKTYGELRKPDIG